MSDKLVMEKVNFFRAHLADLLKVDFVSADCGDLYEFYSRENPGLVLRYWLQDGSVSVWFRFDDADNQVEKDFGDFGEALPVFVLAYQVSDGLRKSIMKAISYKPVKALNSGEN